jgi:hypothetical protein
MFTDGAVELQRLALNMDQIDQYTPPPNPAKITDSRAAEYIRIHGDESWELDALNPDILAGLVRDFVLGVRDESLWDEAVAEEDEHLRLLGVVSEQWVSLTENM